MKFHFHSRNHMKTNFIIMNNRICKACWKCVTACPNDVIGKIDIFFHKHAHISQPDKCKGCSKCIKTCPENAIIPAYKSINVKVV